MSKKNDKKERITKTIFLFVGIVMFVLGLIGFKDYPDVSSSNSIAGAIVMVGGVFIAYRVIFSENFDIWKD